MAGIDSFAKLMLHMDADFGDSSSSSRTPTLINSPTIDNTNFEFGGGAGNFVRASVQGVTYPDSVDFFLDTGDWTVDFWARITTAAAGMVICGQYVDDTNRIIFVLSDSSIQFLATTVANYTTSPAVGTTSFHHYAFVRQGTNFFIFFDGVSQTLVPITAIGSNSIPDLAAPFRIGSQGNGVLAMDGQLDEFRFSKGIARWTSNFTPPTAPYSSDSAVGAIMTPRSFMWGDL